MTLEAEVNVKRVSNETDWDAIEQLAVECRERAMDLARDFFRQGVQRQVKPDQTYVSEADLSIEKELRRMIGARFPSHRILGEEEGGRGADAGDPSAITWIIDPIDGTFSFVNGVPFYSSLLAVVEGSEVQLGWAALPELEWVLHARKGRGAFMNGQLVPPTPSVDGERRRSSEILALADPYRFRMVSAGPVLETLLADPFRCRVYPDALGYMLLLQGAVSGFVDPRTEIWDVAPFHVILPEAGFVIAKWGGEVALTPGGVYSYRLGSRDDRVADLLGRHASS